MTLAKYFMYSTLTLLSVTCPFTAAPKNGFLFALVFCLLEFIAVISVVVVIVIIVDSQHALLTCSPSLHLTIMKNKFLCTINLQIHKHLYS